MPDVPKDRNWVTILSDKKTERDALNKRRDNDSKLTTSYKYEMLDAADQKIKDMIHVTMNRLKVFKAYVEASLGRADEKLYVTSNNMEVKTSRIEDVLWASYKTSDHQAAKRGEFELNAFLDQQACMRGEGAMRILFQKLTSAAKTKDEKGEQLDANISRWDTRYLFYELNNRETDYTIYELERSKASIEAELWWAEVPAGTTIAGKTAVTQEIWTPEENIILLDGKEVFKQPNPFGYVPVVIQKVPIGSMLMDKDTEVYQMESIFFLVRDLIDEYNRCLSILQTLNLKAVKVALQQVVLEGEDAAEYDEIARMGSNTSVTVPGAIQPIPYGEARRSMIVALAELNKALNDGTLSRIMLGDLPGELSAVALVQIEQGQGQVFMPRLGMRGLLKQDGAEMIIRQLKEIGGSFELGRPGQKETFDASDLEGDFDIEFRYSNKSPETDYARLNMGVTYKEADMLDELSILREVMNRDDPEGDLARLYRQRLRALSPSLQIYDGLMALAKLYEDGDLSVAQEIDIVEAELGVSLEQMASGVQARPEPNQQRQRETANMPTILGAGKSSAEKAFELKATPADEGE